jgi:hypothetical protein
VQQKLLNTLISASDAFGILSPGRLEIDQMRDSNGNMAPKYNFNDRWIFELEQLQNKVWATLQVYIADLAVGAITAAVFTNDVQETSTPDVTVSVRAITATRKSRVRPDEEGVLCASQLMRKSGGIV